MTIVTFLVALGVGGWALSGPPTEIDRENPIGFSEIAYFDSARDREIVGYVWYPTGAQEDVALFEDNVVFRGFSAIHEGPIQAGRYPLVILSHGSGGNRANQAWLAVELARQGAIVVAVNHPGSMSRDSAPQTNILTWHRPADISYITDSLLADPTYSPHIDADRIAVVGHSLGGYTALAVGGAELSLDQFIDYCAQFAANPDCTFYREGGVDLAAVDRSQFEQSNRDARVAAIVSIDPAYAVSFTPESLERLAPTLLIAPDYSVWEGGSSSDLKVSELASELGEGATFVEMSGAHHFTFLPECQNLGYYILMLLEKDGELLCAAESGQSRAEYQAETVDAITSFLKAEGIFLQTDTP